MWGVRLGIWSQVLRNRVAQGTGLCVRCRRLVETGSTQRRSSSAVPKDKVIAYDRGRMELLEVLEIREKQLQADEYLPLHETKNNKLCAQKVENAQSKKVLNTNQTSKHGKKTIQKDETTESHVKENVKKRQTKLPVEPSHCQPQNDKGKTIEKKTLKTDKDPTDHKNPRQLLNYKQQEFHCYLETCLFLGLYEKAKKSLYNCVQNPSTHPPFNVSMFNLFIKYWARKGALQETGLYFKLLNKVGLKPNLESYAAALEAFGRNEKQMEGITRCIKQMEADGFSLDQLFHDLPYYGDERQKVLEAIRRVKPSFKPKIKAPKNHPLSDNFYNKLATRSYPKMDFTASFLQERFEEQLQMERNSSITIDSVEAVKPLTDAKIKARDVLASLRSAWRQDLLLALQDLKRQQKKGLSWNSNFIYHYLFLLEEEHYVDAMLQCLTSIPPLGESYSFICRDIGLKIYNRFVILQQLQDYHINKIRLTYNEYCKLLSKEGKDSGLLPREIWENSAYQIFGGSSYLRTNSAWPRSLVMRLGTLLGELMVKTIKMKNDLLSPRSDPKLIPVLYHLYSFRSVQQVGLLIPHPSYIQILQDAEETQLTFDAAFIPMKCPPLPWMSPQSGPYLLSPSQFMRATEGTVQHQGLLEKCPSGQLNPVLDAVTQLGLCPWRINQPILDIIISIFNDKGNEKLDIPPPLSEAPVVQGLLPGMMSIMEKQEHEKEKLRCRKKASEMYSLRVSALYSLSIANYLRDQVFWLPHNMDFRGRTYPCPPYLNHLGSDVTRSLMVFAEGHPLGPKGLDWLKIHLINLTGLKKRCSLQQRKEYAEEIMEDILDSADHPLNGRKWWMESDEPWQTLACCMEIAKAIRSPDPEKYICHFPVHQDGSCNGLQHYAALGRDEVGAKSVNLTPCINPQDVYSEVAEKVEALRKEDAKQGNDIARVLEGFIGRKIVKQTVMTVVYGVTRFGGRLQIEKRLRETESFPQKYVWSASHYLVDQVFHALAKMFTNTREIQYWLTECARLISKSGKAVEWVTPVGLPIIQPYHQVKPVNIKVGTQAVGFKLKSDVFIKPNTLKQKNAFPPNFIHSLDSTHMMLTALYCYARGLTFVSVHDCFWTHADTVDIMNKVCREQFVSLHSEPILKDLSGFLLQKYCSGLQNPSAELQELEKLIKKIPETGSFELSNVLDSTYFFS